MRLAYMVETDWAVHWLRGKQEIVDKLRSLHGEGIALSVISLAELFTGVYYSADPVGARRGLDDFLSSVTVLGIDEKICRTFGEQNARLRKEGRIIEDFDLLIAVTCLNYNLKLLTNNRRHFQRVDELEIISAEF